MPRTVMIWQKEVIPNFENIEIFCQNFSSFSNYRVRVRVRKITPLADVLVEFEMLLRI